MERGAWCCCRAPVGTAGDGLTSGSQGSGQQQQDGLVFPTEHESIYGVVWDMSRDPNRVSTTPCAPLEQRGVLAAPLSLVQPKASRILAKPARRGSPLQSNERAPNGREGESKWTLTKGSREGVELEGCMIGVLAEGDTVLMTGLVGAIPQGC